MAWRLTVKPIRTLCRAFGASLKDEEIADVLTYVRNSFGNKASEISADQVKALRK